MSIKKCFNNLKDGKLKQAFQDKVASGMSEEDSAALTIQEHSKALQQKLNNFRTSIGLAIEEVTPIQGIEDYLAQEEPVDLAPAEVVAETPKTELDTEISEKDINFLHRLPNGDLAASYKEALNNTEEGDLIEIGMQVAGEFFPLITTRKNTNKNTQEGYINNMIASGFLADKKLNSNGEYVFQAAGQSDMYRAMTATVIQDDAVAYMGMGGVKKDGHTFTFNKKTGFVKVLTPTGMVEVNEKELDTKSYRDLENLYGRDMAAEIIASREWANSRQAYREEAPVIKNSEPAMEEEELQLRLLGLLSKLGVKTMSISEYVRKYKTKNGVNPSAKALADIANQVVAYTEGRVEDLAEETAHFINEAMPQDQVENVLRNIHKTEEWAEFSEIYREIYRSEYSEAELDNVVRREILGKVVAKVISNKADSNKQTETQRNIFDRVVEAIQNFFAKVSGYITSETRQELNTYLAEVQKLMTQEDISTTVNTDNFKHNTLTLYSLGNVDPNSTNEKLRRRAMALVQQLRDTEKQYAKTGTGRRTNLRELDKIQRALATNAEVGSITSLVSMLNSNVKALEAAIRDSEKNNKSYVLTDEENILYQFVKNVGEKSISQVRELVIKEKQVNANENWDPVLKELAATGQKVSALRAKIELVDTNNVQRLVNEMLDKHNIPESQRELVTKWVERAQADTNLFHSTFGQLVHAKDGLLNLGGNIIRKMHNESQVEMYEATKDYLEQLRDLGVSTQQISEMFVDGQFIVSETNFNEFTKDVDTIFVDTYKKVAVNNIPAIEAEIAQLEINISNEANPDKQAGMVRQLEEAKERLEAYASYKDMDIDQLIKLKRQHKLFAPTLEEETKRKNMERPRIAAITERVMKDSYYQKYQDLMDGAGVSDETKQELSNLMSDLGDIRKKAYRKEGNKTILDYNTLTETDKEHLSTLQRKRKMFKSYTDELGELKRGLRYVIRNGETQIDPETNQPIVEENPNIPLSEEARMALDLHNLDKALRKSREGQTQVKQGDELFYETLAKIDATEGRESALRFIELNSYMSFTQEFWDGLGNSGNVIKDLKTLKAKSPGDTQAIDNLINNISQATFEMKNSIKMYNKKGNPAEIDADNMTTVVKENILRLKKDIKGYMASARTLLKELEVSDEQQDDPIGTSDVNEAYRTLLEGNNTLESATDLPSTSLVKALAESDHAEEHMTDFDRKAVGDLKISIEQYLGGRRSTVPSQVEETLNRLGRKIEDLKDTSVHAEVIRIVTRQRVAPYYKRFTSHQYTNFYDSLKTTPDLVGALQGTLAQDAMIEITPNTSFFDAVDNQDMNPNYKKDFEGGYLQPKQLDKYKNKKFEQMFGTVVTNADGTKTPSKNANLYKAYEATLDYNRKSLEAMNVGENHNKFLLPQTRKTLTEKVKTGHKGDILNNIKNFTKDTLNYTEDEMAQGDEMYGDDVKVIPKMYIRPLEDPEDVSTDLFYSLSLRAKEAFLRKAKVKHYGDLMSINDKILTREMNGKSPTASNTYKMFQSAIDYNLFGIKETTTYPVKMPWGGTIDLTKIARLFLNFIKFRNLGLNVVIPITSYLTGAVTNRIEGWAGEFIDTRSQKLGGREYMKLAADGMKEIGVVNTRAKINVLGQFFKAFDMNESYRNSKYSGILRNMPRIGMALHAAANFPLYGKTLLGILHDWRIVDGVPMNKTKFMRINNRSNDNRKSLDAKWKTYESSAIYKYIKHEGNKVQYDKDALGKVLLAEGMPLTEEQLDNAVKELHNDIQGNVQYVNSVIDGQIPEDDRVYAQRHYLLSYFMTHRGWLSIATARKFKDRHLNLDTGMVEEGSYRSLFSYFGGVFREFSDGNFYKVVGNFKEAWDKADDMQRRNISRVGKELSVLASIMMLGMILRSAAEDDENEDLFALQLSNYLMYRTMNELSSTQFNIATNFSDTIESPFVGWSTIKNLTKVGDVFSGEEVKYGSYRGMSERGRFITKMVPGMKQYFDLQNMNQTYKTYKFYNQSNFSLTPINLMRINQLIEEEEK